MKYGKLYWLKLKIEDFLIKIPSLFIILFFFILPLVTMLIISISGDKSNSYKYLFTQGNITMIFLKSIEIAVTASIISLLFGYLIAYLIYSFSSDNIKKALIALFIMPLLINSLIKILILRVIFVSINLNGTFIGVVLGMSFLYLPFAIISIYYSLANIDKEIIDSSLDLGASKFQTFFRVILPLTGSGIINGFLLVFLPSITTIIVPQYLGNNKILNIGSIIVNLYSSGNFTYIAATGIIIIVFTFFLVSIFSIAKHILNKSKYKNDKK